MTRPAEGMHCIIRPLKSDDRLLLWDMLYHAIHVPEGRSPPPREVVRLPELARYVRGWGRVGDCGFLASEPLRSEPLGAAWLRLLIGQDKGYGYIDDETPELCIAVLPEYRGRGIGTQLLTCLLASVRGVPSISLSVSQDNPAIRLYQRFGFVVVRHGDGTLTMKRDCADAMNSTVPQPPCRG
jgi:ribosomal protein S18 acetylase RimI-like enzyme